LNSGIRTADIINPWAKTVEVRVSCSEMGDKILSELQTLWQKTL
jgi:hypothetical protein